MYTLNYRTVIKIEGEIHDLIEYMQGIITNDATLLLQKPSIYALFLTPQGKIISDMFLYKYTNCLLLDVMQQCNSELLEKLQMYSIGRNITIAKSDFSVAISNSANNKDALLSTPDPRLDGFYRTIITKQEFENDNNLYDTYITTLIKSLMPEFNDDLAPNKYYPAFFTMDQIAGSVDYNKGCYVGQEVTARSKYRGNVRKCLAYSTLEEDDGTVINAHKEHKLLLVKKA